MGKIQNDRLVLSLKEFQDAKDYWLNQLKDVSGGAKLSYDNVVVDNYKRGEVQINLEPEIVERLFKISNRNSLSLYGLFISNFMLLLYKYTQQMNFVVTAPITGSEKNVNHYNEYVFVKNPINNGMTYREFLAKTSATISDSIKNQHYPSDEILKLLNLQEDGMYNIGFALEGVHSKDSFEQMVELKSDIILHVIIDNDTIQLKAIYNQKKFLQNTIEKFIKAFFIIVKQTLYQSNILINEVELVSETQKNQILHEFNNTKCDFLVSGNMIDLFETKVLETPNEPALLYKNQSWTYDQFNRKANQLARILRKKGVSNNKVVGIMCQRSMEMLIGIFAILKAGGVYMPIDITCPIKRVRFMLEDVEAKALLVNDKGFIADEALDTEVIKLSEEELYAGDDSNLNINMNPDDLAYITYTSGSTGKPKGVMIEHSSVLNILLALQKRYPLTHRDAYLLKTTYTFDVSVTELFGWFLGNGKLAILQEGDEKEPSAIVSAIKQYKITHINFVPSMLNALLNHLDDRDIILLNRLKYVFVAGEAMSLELTDKFNKRIPDVILENLYGPTEATIYATGCNLNQYSKRNMLIGKPLDNINAYIVNKQDQLMPIGVVGELCLAGAGIARGYVKDPQLTNAKFVNNPFAEGEKLYKTGDLAKWTDEGEIDYLGRLDHQVKIRGYRIELGEIETAILQSGFIKETLVTAFQSSNGTTNLCAYYVPDSNSNFLKENLTEYLLERLPSYMLPAYYVELANIPLKLNGKIDRNALPAPVTGIEGQNIELPRNIVEEKLSDIWKEVLDLDTIGINNSFFEYGGDSIKMMQVSTELQKYHIKIKIRTLYEHMTIAKLSDYLYNTVDRIEEYMNEDYLTRPNKETIFMDRVPDSDNMYEPFALSDVQMAYMLGRSEDFELGNISTHVYVEIDSKLDMKRLEYALNKTIERHPMLRTIFLPDGSQKTLKKVPEYVICVDDISNLSEEEKETIFSKEYERMSHYIFEVSQWPLFEFKAYRISSDLCRLMISGDSLISDIASNNIILSDVLRYYEQPDISLYKLEFTYRDYILAMQDFRKSDAYLADKKYWLERVNHFPLTPSIPLMDNPSNIKRPKFNRTGFVLEKSDWEKVEKIAREHNITPSALLCTAFIDVLAFWSNQSHFSINLTLFNRNPFHRDVDKIVGDFTSTMLLEINLEKTTDFWSKGNEIQNILFDALEHRNYDGIEFIRELSKERHFETNKAVMPIVFTCALFDEKEEQKGGFELLGDVRKSITQTSQVYLDSQVVKLEEGIWLYWDYVEQLFDRSIIKDMFSCYQRILQDLARNMEPEILRIDNDMNEFVRKYNDTDEAIVPSVLHKLFMDQVDRTPHNIAIQMDNICITYLELNNKSNQVARYLKDRGVTRGDYVGVMTYREPDTIALVMGILKVGAAYVPIDYDWPSERQNYVAQNSNCYEILSVKHIKKMKLEQYAKENLKNISKPEDTAYVIYTSGSTGKPKGVVINHGPVSNTILDINQKYKVSDNDRVIGISSMCFDLSVYDIFGSLACGACLVMVEEPREMERLFQIVCDQKITIWNSVPKYMELMIETILSTDDDNESYWSANANKTIMYRNCDSLRLVLLSGDWIPLSLPKKINNYFENAVVISLGGATEASIWSIYYPIEEMNDQWKSIPYGMPLANQKVYLLNYKENICPVGVEGEIYIGGIGLADRYLNDEEKTNHSFKEDPKLGRLYRTGDYGVMHQKGYIEFLGRKDMQIKIKGYRIEIGEIENCILEYEKIKNAAVIIHTNEKGERQICAFYVADEIIEKEELRNHLLRKLPSYMIPEFFIDIDSIPLTSNGKVDQKLLMEYNIESDMLMEEGTLPENQLEMELTEILKDILHIDKVFVNTNLFEFGLNSILLMQMRTIIVQRYHIEIAFKEFFTANTIRKLRALIERKEKLSTDLYPHKEQEKDKMYESFPITEVQMAYLLGRNEAFELGGISTHGYVELETKLDIKRMNKALVREINHQPMLRAIVMKNGTQKVLEGTFDYTIEVVDLSDKNSIEREDTIKNERERMSHHVFDTEQWPLFEVKAYRMNKDLCYMMCGFDLIVCDGASMQILTKELMSFYKNTELDLPETAFTFRDYVLAQKEFEKSELFLRDREFWMKKIDDFPQSPALLLKKLPSKIKSPKFNRYSKVLCWEDWNKIKQKANINKITSSALLCAAYAKVLGFWSNQTRFAINSTVFTRYPFNDEVLEIIGDFTSVQLLDINLVEGESFWELADRVQKVIIEAIEHRHYDGVKFIKEIAKINNNASRAIMPVVFTSMLFGNNHNTQDETLELGDIKMSVSQTPQVYLDYQVSEMKQGLMITWDYVDEIFDETVIETMFSQYIGILIQLLNGDNAEIKLISKGEQTFIEQYNSTEKSFDIKTLHQLFHEQVKLVPDKKAIILDDEYISYQKLHTCSNQVARYLRENGIGRNDMVGVMARRKIETIVNIMGVLKSGAAYIPLEPTFPEERIKYIQKNSNSRIILDVDSYTSNHLNGISEDDIEYRNEGSDYAYTIYTSGSTGNPKGVLISHETVINTILDINQRYQVGRSDNILGISSMCFDLSVYDIFGALSSGATLVMIDDNKDMEKILSTIEQKEITLWNSVPAIMELFIDYIEEWKKQDILYWQRQYGKEEIIDYFDEFSLRTVLLSGDWIPLSLPERIKRNFSQAEIVSLGGATECSIWSIFYNIKENDIACKSIPYGMPLSNQSIYILNYEQNLCPIGVMGEIYIGGAGVAVGYLNDKEKTEAAFMEHEVFGRIYKTGDFGVMHKEGYVEFLGRQDTQIKIRGYRIELAEIENSLLRYPGIMNAAVLVFKNKKQENYLCAYLVKEGEIEIDNVKDFLADYIPEYMIPAQYIMIDEMPLTDNGKINRKRLPKPSELLEVTTEYVAPQNDLQRRVLEIVQEIVETEKIGIHDNILELGLSSSGMIALTTKVQLEFHVKLPLEKVFRAPTIKGIVKSINELNKDEIEEEYYTLLNKKTDKNIFLFPPVVSVGMVYMNMMKLLDTHSAYSFDFIENSTDLIEQYINCILKIQPEGTYTLMGHSAGGNIAFEVAKALERKGFEVSDVILMDSYYINKEGDSVIAFENNNEYVAMMTHMVEQLYDSKLNGIQSNNNKIRNQILHYFEYLKDINTSGQVKATLHFIASEGDIDLKSKLRINMDKWRYATKGAFHYYQGYGKHDDMLTEQYAGSNMQELQTILREQ